MSENRSTQDAQARFKELVSNFKPKLPRKLALLMPFKDHIKELLARRASHDDIRLILGSVKIIVSNDTVHRFCRRVIGQKAIRPYKPLPRKNSSTKARSAAPSSSKTESKSQETLERYEGPWSKKKNGPRIANPKKL